jgi:hypothetical protein
VRGKFNKKQLKQYKEELHTQTKEYEIQQINKSDYDNQEIGNMRKRTKG